MHDRFGCRRASLCFLVLVSLASLAHPPPARGASAGDRAEVNDLKQMMRSWVHRYEVESASAALMVSGMPIRKLHYGMLATDPGRIASLSKAITAICVAHFIDQGRLAFNTQVGLVLSPTFAKFGRPADPRFAAATIEQLMTHTAGYSRWVRGSPKSGNLQTTFQRALQTKLRSDPGGHYAYSNVGYITLGMIIEQVSGHPYEEECRRIVLDRLGAQGSIDPELRHRAPNGGWVISAVDYLKFMQVWDPQAGVIGPTARRWLDARIAQSNAGNPVYSLGMRVERTPTGVRYSHGGSVAHEDRGGSYALKFGDGLTVVALLTGVPARGGVPALRNGLTNTFARH